MGWGSPPGTPPTLPYRPPSPDPSRRSCEGRNPDKRTTPNIPQAPPRSTLRPVEAPPPLSSRPSFRRSRAGGNLPLRDNQLPCRPAHPHRRSRPSFRRSRAGGNLPLRDHQPPCRPALPPSSFPPLFSSFPRRREPPPPRPPALATSQPPTVIPAKAGIQRGPGRGAPTNPSRIPHFPPPLASFLRRQESRGAVPGWFPPPPATHPPPAVLSCPPTGQTGGHTCQPSD